MEHKLSKQQNLIHIYNRLKKNLKKYENPLRSKIDLDSRYDLWSMKNVEIEGRKRNEVFFAGLIIQSTYVGFYFMPVYAETDLRKVFHPDLLKLLKGKSCFHIKYLDSDLEKYINHALEEGFNLYKAKEWI